jgi:hypothetical protein
MTSTRRVPMSEIHFTSLSSIEPSPSPRKEKHGEIQQIRRIHAAP